MPAKTKSNLFTYVDSILLLELKVNIYRYILTIYKDIINTSILLLVRTRNVIDKINIYIDINNISNLGKNSNNKTLVNIRLTLARLGFNNRYIIIRSKNVKLDF